MSDDLSDDELMVLYSDGNAEAFDVIFDRHRSAVYNFAVFMVRNADAAEEVLQETFLAVARSARDGNYEARGRFRMYLMRIARNRCFKVIESDRVRHSVLNKDPVTMADAASSGLSPVEQVDADETLGLIRSAIADLPDRQREAIVLYAFEQMSYRQIGDVLDVPTNTVKTLIHRARARLADVLSDYQQENGNGV